MKVAHIFNGDKFESRGIKFTQSTENASIKVISCLRGKEEKYPSFILKTIKKILKNNVDYIHAHRISGFVPAILTKILKPKIKIIYDKHDIHKYDFIFDRLLFLTDRVIVASELHLEYIKKLKEDSLIIPNYSEFKPISKDIKEEIRKEINLTKEEVLVLFQGSIVAEYGLDLLIDAIPSLDKRIKIGILGWIKDEAYWNLLKEKFTNRVIYLGTKEYSEMNKYVGTADIGVVLFKKSKLTLFGNPAKLFEFISCKIPVVTTDIECVSKYIKKYKNGLVINNKKELAKALNKLANKKTRESFIKNSPDLPWEKEFKEYLKILK